MGMMVGEAACGCGGGWGCLWAVKVLLCSFMYICTYVNSKSQPVALTMFFSPLSQGLPLQSLAVTA